MRRCLASLGATIAVVLAIGAGSAFAEDLPTVTTTTPESGLTQSQSSTQTEKATNDIDQNASSSATSAPGVQSNTNTPVSVGGSGGDGNVTQSNDSTANSGAVNKNNSVQGIDQDESSKQTQTAEQEGGGCCTDHNTPAATFVPGDQSQSSLDQTQRSKQYEKARNDIDQNADSTATSAPGVQSNVNAPVRVGSDGNNGDVNQSNSSTANSFAGNKNNSWQGIDQDESSKQSQRAEQEPSSCCDGGGGGGDPQSQRSYQKEQAKNDIDQNATSTATSAPGVQTNVNEPVTVASNDCNTVCAGGSGGNVDQSNSSTANSGAGNKNNSAQGIAQDESSYQRQWAEQEGSGCCGGSSGELYQKQKSRQEERAKNDIDQNATSTATSAPGVQANVNAPVRVGSDGSEGDVNQSNSSTANSAAWNKNRSGQWIDQSERSKQKQGAEQEGSGCCDSRSGEGLTQSQRSYQKEKAKNDIDQNATSTATSAPGVQSNTNTPVYVAEKDACGVCGGGSSGDVNQSNSSTANSFAKNKNNSWQGIDQDESSYQRQFGEQEGSSCCDTVFKPELVGSDGGLTQRQKSKQKEEAKNDIDQNATSTATSAPGVQSNVNAPVGGWGSGDVNQSNSSTANSGAFNKNNSVQWIDQDERSKQSQWAEQELSGCCGGGSTDPSQSQRSYQKEKAKNDIDQNATSTATSIPGVQSNVNAPVSVIEKCVPTEPKDPNQSNSSTANSFAGNWNNSVQGIDQDERSYQRQGAEQELGGCCGGSSGDLTQRQRSKQKEEAKNDIDQNATSTATSAPGSQTNENAPVSVGGYGSPDEVNQSNDSTANSGAFNKNNSVQRIDQYERSKQTQWAEQEVARCCDRAKPGTFSRRR
jgi:hypothetical protein